MAATAVTAALAVGAPLAGADDSGGKNGRFTAGTPGVGDVYYPLAGNGGYDVRHYDIAGSYDPATDVWSATSTIEAVATADLYRFNLDFDGMTITSLTVGGKPAGWTRDGAELVVVPRQKVRAGSPMTIVTSYSGVPKEFVIPLEGFELRTGFMATDDGATVAGQPDVAAGWFPVNDHPRDKAAYTFHVTVPDGLGVVANGFLVGERSANGRTTFDWDAPEPMASYLATIDIGEWDVRQWSTPSGLPVYDAVDPDLLDDPVLGPAIDSSLSRQGEVLDVLSAAFGPYPFSTVGAIVDDQDDLFFALETQTRPVYSKYFWPDGGDAVVAHELAHQWYGDDVALEQWQDIWLNEGWATYAEWLWAEHEGFFTPQDALDFYLAVIPDDDPFWAFVIGEPPADDLFGEPVYLRGGLTLQVLRNRVGDADFFEIAKQWASQRSGGTGTTAQFIALAESVSGQQLDDLFDAWLFTGSKPEVTSLAGARSGSPDARSQDAASAVESWGSAFGRRIAHGRY
ncbi:metallopeptidase [Knoellia aerolata DSM 18566]|uniref:Aminopeptidase N n=1 Tax=Knoellia aerolata DSM 18566 TaxID=1385519 RepID=A0A0A0JV36_9MICO|nr:metallopeptidase [Knoellia aerolata DSM 18566]